MNVIFSTPISSTLVLRVSTSLMLPGTILTKAGSFVSVDDISINSICGAYDISLLYPISEMLMDDLVTIAEISYAKFSEPVNKDLKILFCEILSLPIILRISERCLGSRFGFMLRGLCNFSHLNLALFRGTYPYILTSARAYISFQKSKFSFKRGIRSFNAMLSSIASPYVFTLFG